MNATLQGFLRGSEIQEIINSNSLALNISEVKEMPVTLKNGSIRKRPDNRWEIRYYFNGKRYSVFAKTQKEVIAKQKKHMRKIKNGDYIGNHTFKEYAELWLKLYKVSKLTVASLKNTKNYLNHIYKKFGSMKIKEIKTSQLQNFLNSMPATRTRELVKNTLKQVFDKATVTKIIKNNPFVGIEISKYTKKTKDVLNDEQIKQTLVHFKNKKTEGFIKLLMLTGMRRGEAIKLQPQDINFQEGFLQIKGTKTKTSFRKFPLSEELEEFLKELTKNIKANNNVFNFHIDLPGKHFTELIKQKKWQNISLHSLRHTFTTNCIKKGLPIKATQNLLGHSQIKMTADVYAHMDNEYSKNAIKKLGNILS